MLIGVAGPCQLSSLAGELNEDVAGLDTHSFPLISQIVLRYLDAGHRVVVFTTSLAVDETIVLRGLRLTVYVCPRRGSQKSLALDVFRKERRGLLAALKTAKPDVVHAHWTYEYASAALSYSKHSLVTAHDGPLSVVQHYPGMYWKVRSMLGVLIINRARNTSAVAPELAAELRRLRIRRQPIAVIANGIAIDSRTLQVEQTRSGYFQYGVVANGFDQRKNTTTTIEAFVKVREKFSNTKLILIGAGHGTGESAATWCAENKIDTTAIEFRGKIGHEQIVDAFINEIDVLVHSSRWEACSMAILEALSFGIPVIGGKASGGVPFTLGYGRTGVLVDVDSSEEVAAGMATLLSDRTLYSELASAARTSIIESFSLEAVASNYLATLLLIDSGSHGPDEAQLEVEKR